ncbi:MAG: Fe-S-containing protein [Deferribacterales bacterium]
MKIILKALLLGVLVMSVAAWSWGGGKVKEAKAQNGVVKIALKDVNDGKAHYYYTKINGKDVKYFILKSSDGVIRAAFDACDVCYREKKGYSQQGDFMVCNNCGMKFHSMRINEVKGGCNPSPLTRTTDKEFVYLKTTDIASGAMYF